MRLRLDTGWTSVVAVCACGWRDVADSREAALILAADHERRVHPRDVHARVMLRQLRDRADRCSA